MKKVILIFEKYIIKEMDGKCPICKGMGKTPDGLYTCETCKGTGKYSEDENKNSNNNIKDNGE